MTDEAETDVVESAEDETERLSNWEFRGRPPTSEEVVKLLSELRPVWGVKTVDYAEFVQALPQKQKQKSINEKGLEVTSYVDVWRLYMGVAGRVKMIEEVAEVNKWRVDFVPEPTTPTGCPGMLQMDDRIVYREYVEIWPIDMEQPQHRQGYMLGRKPGTAWVPSKGGSNAAGSNPYEKVETSARGRAIAAWGFGVLPGTGIASLEEMQGVAQADQAGPRQDTTERVKRPRGDVMQELLTAAEEVRQARGLTDAQQREKLADYVKKSFGLEIAVEEGAEGGGSEVVSLDWTKVKEGQLVLTLNALTDTLKKIRSAESPV